MSRPKYVGLVPARAGSQGIKGKNLKKIGDRTLVQIAIEAAISSGVIDCVVVSSDGLEILSEASLHDAIPHQRPAQFATNDSLAREVVFDFLESPTGKELDPKDYIVYLQPTSPFRNSQHIIEAIELSKAHMSKSVVSIVKIQATLEKLIQVDDFSIKPLDSIVSSPSRNRQDLTEVVTANGAIYVFSKESFLTHGDIPILGSIPYLMSTVDSIDVDSVEDLMFARLLKERRND
jgi:CMP-N,N'-diacetyllegionaminic acid synthase